MTQLDIARAGNRHARNGADPLRRRPRHPLRLSPSRSRTGTPRWFSCSTSRATSTRGIPPSSMLSPPIAPSSRSTTPGSVARPAKRPTISQRWRGMQSPSSICSAFLRSTCWAFLSAAASPNRSPPKHERLGPKAHPRRHRAERRRGTSVSGSAGGVFPNRCAGPPPAAVLYEVVRQPVVRPGLPEADEGASRTIGTPITAARSPIRRPRH